MLRPKNEVEKYEKCNLVTNPMDQVCLQNKNNSIPVTLGASSVD